MITLPRFLVCLGLVCATPLHSHEFWIASPDYQVETGENIKAYTKNGQRFSGIDLAYFDRRAARFEKIDATGARPVKARAGDSPVYDQPAEKEGLFTLIYQTTPDKLTYANWEKFQKFADHKAFKNVKARHEARNLPSSGFSESYARFAKGLFAVGSGAGSDAPRGLELEIIALKNPYVDDMKDGLPVQVLYQQMPRSGAQVEVFERSAEGEVSVTLYTTDDTGVAVIPVQSGYEYLLDNVLLREPSKALSKEAGTVWETLWAALTFAVR